MAKAQLLVQPAQRRAKNFQEVSLGYSQRLATGEATRCPQCADATCLRGCPLGIDIPGFIRLLREGNTEAAYRKIKENNPFPGICGRICSAPCEPACILNEEKAPIGIRALERFAFDRGCWDRRPTFRPKTNKAAPRGKKIAVIGSGPTGLAAAYELAKKDFQVTIFEALDRPGGVLRYGIPEFRIPKKILDFEIEQIKDLGVTIQTNAFVGQTINFQEIFTQGYAAILLATGAGTPQFMDLPGANLGGVFYGEEFLMRVNLNPANFLLRKTPNFYLGEKVAVIGSGNTALDCARAAVRYGREVTLIFRRTEEEMRVRDEEREFGKQEKVHFEPLVRPLEVLSNETSFVSRLRCVRMDYADAQGTGKWQLTEVPGSEFVLECDTVIIGIGHRPNSLIAKFDNRLKLDEDGTLWVDEETFMTSVESVFAAGNIVTNAGPVVEAIAAGKKAAEKIAQYVEKK